MTENPSALAAIDPELLVASFTPSGEVGEANPAWRSLLGEQEDPWEKLSVDDKRLARQSLSEAAAGSLVTNQIIMIQAADRDEPLPILFNFLPVHMPSRRKEAKVRAVAVTGEVLAEPTTWTESQTLRHRMETLGRMTMGIAHDFNNLLSGILGYSELIQSQLSERSSAAPLMANMRTIEQAALDGAALVRKIQQYIRQETETRFTEQVRFCVDDVFEPQAGFREALETYAPFDVVLSDMAPNTTGNKDFDISMSEELFARALDIATAVMGYERASLVANIEATTLSVTGTFTSGDYTSSGTVTANKFASAVHDEELARNYTQADNTAATTVFSFAHATYQGCYCDYVLRRGTAHSRIGTLKVIQLNGSTVSLDDTGTDEAGSGSPGTTWSAAVNGSNIDVKLAVDNSDTDDVFVTYHARFLKVYSA